MRNKGLAVLYSLIVMLNFNAVNAQNYWGSGHIQPIDKNPNPPVTKTVPAPQPEPSGKKVTELPDVPDVGTQIIPPTPVKVTYKPTSNASSPVLELGASTEKIPLGTELKIALNTNLDAKKSKEGQPFSANIKEDVIVNSQIVVPAGTLIRGRIGKVKKPGIFSKSGSILLNFDHIVTPLGKQITLDIDLSKNNDINKKGALIANKGLGEAIKESAKSGFNTTKSITKAGYDVGMAAGKVPVIATAPAGAAIGTVAGTTVFATKTAIAIFKKGGNPVFNSGDELDIIFAEDLDIPVN